MDPWLELLGAWWWVGPTAIGLGAVGYGVISAPRRRARRLELDAARQEVGTAYNALIAARAHEREAKARLQAAQTQPGVVVPGLPSVAQARGELQAAKAEHRTATLTLRAKRSGVKSARAHLHAATGETELPVARLLRRHDSVTARWMEYETDVAKRIAFPQMSDARHPLTGTFLTMQQQALELRPESARTRMTPEQFLRYRDAVAAVETSFAAAEQDAWREARASGAVPPAPERDQVAPWATVAQQVVSLSAEAIAQAAEAAADALANRSRAASAPSGSGERAQRPAPKAPPGPAGQSRPAESRSEPPTWPVPSRSPRSDG
ncbi:hypothetical protein [Microbacterium thalassium]|uniref:Phage protein D n=1 Tax=Microbacterium thalassium TaxID=362649 RepID=A0A7X0KTK7_9MICO|nr:hypothetical protein [Microbacterium thalassium]MBB6390226.1 phage protein D [Microbacterium thalassium]GLK25334.1 hypothetical protein GCM10017607_26530 [Microbacterium thalassium]